MNYENLFDFKDQKIVDEIYQRVKDKEVEGIEEAYQKITERNQSTLQTTRKQYDKIRSQISQILEIIGMMIFAILFIVCGSFILAIIGLFINAYVAPEPLKGLYDWMVGFGTGVYNVVFLPHVKMSMDALLQLEPEMELMIYTLGLTVIFIFVFLVIYIVSLFKKKEKVTEVKKTEDITIEKAYRHLRVTADDSWKYIQSCLQREVKNRRHKDFYDRYYASYICIFENYQVIDCSFQTLKMSQKIMLCIHTCLNTAKNVLGTLAKPFFFSFCVLWLYVRMFPVTIDDFSLEILMSGSALSRAVFSFMKACYGIVSKTPIQSILQNVYLEFAIMISFCIVLSLIYIIYALAYYKVREYVRQYNRRLTFYTKKNMGIYDEKMKYPKEYLYSIEFSIVVLIVIIYLILLYANTH